MVARMIDHLRDSGIRVQLEGDRLIAESDAEIAEDTRELIRQRKPVLLAEARREARRERLLEMLRQDPGLERAYFTDDRGHTDYVILALGIRGVGTCELSIPRENHDPFKLLEFVKAADDVSVA